MISLTIGIAIVLFIIIIYMIFSARSTEKALLYGFWVGDTEFCENAGLISYYLAIGDTCALTLQTADSSVISEVFELNLSGMCLSPQVCKERNYSARVKREYDENSGALPDRFSIKHYPVDGRLYLYDDGELIAELIKENRV